MPERRLWPSEKFLNFPIRVNALDRDGSTIDETVTGLLAVCLQHEIDHLQGKLFVDYLSPLKRQRIRQQLEKEQRRRA